MPMTDLKTRRFEKKRKEKKKRYLFFLYGIYHSFFFFYREKTRSLLINVFRTRRSNAGLTSNEV